MTKEELLQQGKALLADSLDDTHDSVHVEAVAKHAERIYAELLRDGWFQNFKTSFVDIEILCWWHDAYKATKQPSIFVDIAEGIGSAHLFRRASVGVDMNKRIKTNIVIAILLHNLPFALLFAKWFKNPFMVILMESDAIDGVRHERVKLGFAQSKSQIKKYAYVVLNRLFCKWIKSLLISKYARGVFKNVDCNLIYSER
jgi:hypothetical protein